MLFNRASGCRLWDLDGREYIDLCCSHGATLLGHGDPRVRTAVEAALGRGAACSYESEIHTEFARLLCETVPCLERVRFTGSGTEATMHCIRLARAYTGRTRLLRFEGNFHGYHDQVMFGRSAPQPGTGTSALPGESATRLPGGTADDPDYDPPLTPQSSGVVSDLSSWILQVPYNRPDLVARAFAESGDQLAAVICEPVFYNAGCIRPTPEFMSAVRDLTHKHGTLLIFDEVLSAFRMGPGGAQEYLGVTPDLCTLGKAVGGGYPLSVFGGRQDILRHLMPEGDCQHSGTYNAHPVVIAAGLAALQAYREPGFYPHIHSVADRLYAGLQSLFDRCGVAARVQGLGARFGVYFGITREVCNYGDTQQHDRARMLRFVAAAIDNGVYFHDYGGAACHHGFCHATTLADVDEALDRLAAAVKQLAAQE